MLGLEGELGDPMDGNLLLLSVGVYRVLQWMLPNTTETISELDS